MLSSEEWAAKYVYLHQMWAFQAKDNLTDEEKIVLEWMQAKIEGFREKENVS